MKHLVFILILTATFLCQSNAEQHTFNQILYDAHHRSVQLHNLMEMHFNRVRLNVSDQMMATSEMALRHIVTAIRIAAAAENSSSCQGTAISACSSTADLAIESVTQHVYNSLDGPQSRSIELLNLVLTQFGYWTLGYDSETVRAHLSSLLDETTAEFGTETLQLLREEIDWVRIRANQIPVDVAECVAIALNC